MPIIPKVIRKMYLQPRVRLKHRVLGQLVCNGWLEPFQKGSNYYLFTINLVESNYRDEPTGHNNYAQNLSLGFSFIHFQVIVSCLVMKMISLLKRVSLCQINTWLLKLREEKSHSKCSSSMNLSPSMFKINIHCCIVKLSIRFWCNPSSSFPILSNLI